MTQPRAPLPTGRSLRWRLGAAMAGIAFLAAGTALILRPALLSWVVAGTLGAVGLLLLASALFAAGNRPPS